MKRFVAGVQAGWNVRPVAPFGTTIEIGDIGRTGPDGGWEPVSSTQRRFGVAPDGIRTQPAGETAWSLTSGNDVEFKLYAEGETSELVRDVADARARAEIGFHSSDAFAFGASGIEISTASDVDAVLQAIRHAYHERADLPEDKRWDKDLAYVFAVADAASFTALVTKESGTTVVVTAGATVGPPEAAASLAFGVNIGISSKQLLSMSRTPAPRAFYRAYRLAPSIFRRWDHERQGELRGLAAPSQADLLSQLDALDLPAFEDAFEVVGDGAPQQVVGSGTGTAS